MHGGHNHYRKEDTYRYSLRHGHLAAPQSHNNFGFGISPSVPGPKVRHGAGRATTAIIH